MIEEDNNAYSSTDSSEAVHAADMRETARALELAMAQIELTLRESDRSIETLIDAITTMAGCARRIEQQLDESGQCSGTVTARASIQKECHQSNNSMQQAVSAFQFYDLLSQRLWHIRDNLAAVTEVMQAPDLQHPSMWRQLNQKLRSLYSLKQEQTMYQALLSGLSAETVISEADVNKRGSCGDIELF